MKILLINNNPVVSRLTALSARKEDIEIDEIQEVTELNATKYDIVFVDADSLSKDVENAISDNINAQKKVLFYAQDDTEDSSSFDMSILKPFLPSEVSAIIRSVDEEPKEEKPVVADTIQIEEPKIEELKIEKSEATKSEVEKPQIEPSKEEKHFDVLAEVQESKRDELFDLDLSPVKQNSSDELTEALDKIDLDADLNPESFDAKLKEAFPEKSIDLDDELFTNSSTDSNKELNEKIELFEIDLNDDKTPLNEELFIEEKKEGSDELFDFDFEKSEELDFETLKREEKIETVDKKDEFKIETAPIEPVKVEKETLVLPDTPKVEKKEELETKILDQAEISNIKDLLENKEETTTDEMTLEDLMPATASMMGAENIYEEKKAEVKEKESKKEESREEIAKENILNVDSNTAVETLQNLSIESLRELLAGARINISIKFPKAK